jgi:hypothetical protein
MSDPSQDGLVALQRQLPADLIELEAESRREAGKSPLLNLVLVERTDPSILLKQSFAKWPSDLTDHITEGLPGTDGRIIAWNENARLAQSFRALAIHCGDKEALARFQELTGWLAEALTETHGRDLLPPWLDPAERWTHALVCLAGHRLKTRGAIFWRGGEGGSVADDLDLQRLRSEANVTRQLRSLAMDRGMQRGAKAIEVWFLVLRDLWGATLEVLNQLLPEGAEQRSNNYGDHLFTSDPATDGDAELPSQLPGLGALQPPVPSFSIGGVQTTKGLPDACHRPRSQAPIPLSLDVLHFMNYWEGALRTGAACSGSPEYYRLPEQGETDADRDALKLLRACCTNYWEGEKTILSFVNAPASLRLPILKRMKAIAVDARRAAFRAAFQGGSPGAVENAPAPNTNQALKGQTEGAAAAGKTATAALNAGWEGRTMSDTQSPAQNAAKTLRVLLAHCELLQDLANKYTPPEIPECPTSDHEFKETAAWGTFFNDKSGCPYLQSTLAQLDEMDNAGACEVLKSLCGWQFVGKARTLLSGIGEFQDPRASAKTGKRWRVRWLFLAEKIKQWNSADWSRLIAEAEHVYLFGTPGGDQGRGNQAGDVRDQGDAGHPSTPPSPPAATENAPRATVANATAKAMPSAASKAKPSGVDLGPDKGHPVYPRNKPEDPLHTAPKNTPETPLYVAVVAEATKPKEIHARVQFDVATWTITLDGERFPIDDPIAFQIYRVVAEAEMPPIPHADIKLVVRACNGDKAIQRRRNTLPEKLRDTLISGNNGWYVSLPVKKVPT